MPSADDATTATCTLCKKNHTDKRRERARQATLTEMEQVAGTTPAPPAPTTSAKTPTSNADAAGSTSTWDKLNRATATGNSTTAGTTRCQTCKRELEQYTEMPVLGRSACPYKWWAANHHLFPLMAGVARQLLCSPATSVSKFGEQAFSVAGPAAWNSLPTDIRTTNSTPAFKKKLSKTFLFSKFYDI